MSEPAPEPAKLSRPRHRPLPPPAKPPLWQSLLKHPLTLLALSSLLIPQITTYISQSDNLRTKRQAQAETILRQASTDTRRLYSLITVFESMEKDLGNARTENAEQRRAALQEKVYELYGTFEAEAWWWYWEINRESGIFGWLGAEEIARYKNLCVAYQANLKESVQFLEIPWKKYLSEKTEKAPPTTVLTVPQVRDRIEKLREEREQVSAQMAQLFL